MPREATDPLAWLVRAKSSLARARAGRISPEVLWEEPCFDAQQAAEKALKALLVALGIPFPKTHDLERLLELIRPRIPVPLELEALVRLNPFAVASRSDSTLRGHFPGETDALAEAIQRLSQLVTEFPQLQEMDINPFLIGPSGTTPIAVDARMSVE